MVPVAGPLGRACRAHRRGRARGAAGGALSDAPSLGGVEPGAPLAAVVAASDPALVEHALESPAPVPIAAAVADPVRRFVLEAVREGYLLHYGEPRAFGELDDDLRLLGGDALYALGLERLAEVGDLEAVAALADLISHSAQAHAEGRAGDADRLWELTVRALAPAPR